MATVDTQGTIEEHGVLTERCGLLDRSEQGKLALTGSGAVEFLNGQVTNELADLHPGEGRYAAFLTHKGKMLGDLRILAVGEDPEAPPSELLLDTERVALQALFDMIRRFKVGYDVELHKRTVECSLFSLIGPGSRGVAAVALGIDPRAFTDVAQAQASLTHAEHPRVLPDAEHAHTAARIAEHPVRLIATGADGIDVLCASDSHAAVRDALLQASAEPVSEQTAEIVRIERGRPRYGIDIDDTTIPQEAGLNERAVSFTKGCYVGQETVARLYYKGKPNRHLRGLRLSAPATSGEEMHFGERPIGRLGSVALSPSLGPIALALVRREAEPGGIVSVGDQGVSATVLELPFAP
jgi:folate-binding protein YgfZ